MTTEYASFIRSFILVKCVRSFSLNFITAGCNSQLAPQTRTENQLVFFNLNFFCQLFRFKFNDDDFLRSIENDEIANDGCNEVVSYFRNILNETKTLLNGWKFSRNKIYFGQNDEIL